MSELRFPAPTRPVSYNEAAKMHWAPLRKRLAPWRTRVHRMWRSSDVKPFTGPVEITVVLPFARKARRDPANYVSPLVKAIVDELTRPAAKKDRRTGLTIPSCRSEWPECGHAFPDDTPEYVSVAEPEFHYGTDEVIVRFETL